MKYVKELMIKQVVTVTEDADIKSICKILIKKDISGVPVINGRGLLSGFVSERDIIAAVPKATFPTATAKQVMQKRVRTIQENAPLTHASKIFSEENYRQLPVLKGTKLVGIISRHDVVHHLMGRYY